MMEMNYMCHACHREDVLVNMWHLASGEFLCDTCYNKDNVLREKYVIPKIQLMINPDAKQGKGDR